MHDQKGDIKIKQVKQKYYRQSPLIEVKSIGNKIEYLIVQEQTEQDCKEKNILWCINRKESITFYIDLLCHNLVLIKCQKQL